LLMYLDPSPHYPSQHSIKAPPQFTVHRNKPPFILYIDTQKQDKQASKYRCIGVYV